MSLHDIKSGLETFEVLTQREKEILLLAIKGLRNKEMADRLFISPGTVKKHLDNIFKKLNVCNKIEALSKVKLL